MVKKCLTLLLLFAAGRCFAATIPPAGHVFVVMEENHSYSSMMGSSSMPYLNSLAKKYGSATQYYANTHPSIGNYLMLTTGQIITNSDGYTGTVTADNIVRHLLTAGKTWKSYAESLPSIGYTGGDKYPYIKHHNPLAYFSDVAGSSVQKMNLVPFTHFASDLANNTLPQFSFIVPNQLHNAHDGSLAQADAWLQSNIAALISSAVFQKDGLLIILTDESYSNDTSYGGGHVEAVMIGPSVRPGFQSAVHYQHQNMLKMMMQALGMSSFPGASSTAPSMSEFFVATPNACTLSSASPSVTICSHTPVASLTSPVRVQAGTTSASTVIGMVIYVDGKNIFHVGTPSLDTDLTLGKGTHRLTVQGHDSSGAVFQTTENIVVQ